MTPIRRHIGQGYQHKGAILQPWVRQDQLVGRLALLRFGGKIAPMLVGLQVGQNHISHCQKIDIQGPRAPACVPYAAESGLYRMKCRQDLIGRPRLPHRHQRRGIHIVRSCACGEARRAKQAAWLDIRSKIGFNFS